MVYPGTQLIVPRSICLDAFWAGKMDAWFSKSGVDMDRIRDRDGVLHFDVVVGAEEGERRGNS